MECYIDHSLVNDSEVLDTFKKLSCYIAVLKEKAIWDWMCRNNFHNPPFESYKLVIQGQKVFINKIGSPFEDAELLIDQQRVIHNLLGISEKQHYWRY